MPVPDVLRTLSLDPAFWDEYFGGGHADDPQPAELRVTFPVAQGYGLVLEIDRHDGTYGLGLRTPITIEPVPLGWDGPDWLPHGLTWAEVDLVGRVTALDDPSLPHPGLPVALLARFAPITAEDDPAAVRDLLSAALRSLTVPAPPLEQEPLFADAGQPRPVLSEARVTEYLRVTERDLRTLRTPGSELFPFADLAELVRLAERRIARLRAEPWYTEQVASAARTANRPALLAALDPAGCDHPTVLDALTEPVVPEEAAWVIATLAVPLGAAVTEHGGVR
ncbi:hypothetical protein WEI85_03560 [Actinomycetes bacterium KLBMP 9797]